MFVYVFSQSDAEDLLDAGFTLMLVVESAGMYLFENKDDAEVDWDSIEHVFTNTLSF